MKLKNIFYLFLAFTAISFFNSCNDENDPLIRSSVSTIEMEGEGGETIVSLENENWIIAGVINKNGDVNLFGKIYSTDGEMIKENTPLKLDGLGKLESAWSDKGFVIEREDASSFKLIVKENYTEEAFNFAVVLQSGEELKEIFVKQKESEVYLFDKIEYTIQKGDGDSLYWTRQSNHRFLNISSPSEISISPYSGIDIVSISYFVSDNYNAFNLLKDGSVLVEIPSDISDDRVYLNGERRTYSNEVIRKPHEFDTMITVQIPAGDSEFYNYVEFYARKVSYFLTLTNKRTEKKKVIEGKWIETAPTGNYEIKWVSPTKPEE